MLTSQQVRFADIFVLLADPKDVIRGGSGSDAVLAVATIVRYDVGGFETVGGPDTACNDGWEYVVELGIISVNDSKDVFDFELFFVGLVAEVGQRSALVDRRVDAHHVLAEMGVGTRSVVGGPLL